jgi:hypothetical protein
MDFDKLAQGAPEVDPKDPLALYETLDTQFTHVELRPAQQQLLTAWAARRGDRDVVLKLATGAGKTTVGLVALYSHMRETQRPCMFLCPTNQLVDQVVDEGRRCGVSAVAVTGGADIPPEALAGTSLVVTSVQSIFQARAGRFQKAGFYAILIDDAHAAVDIVRQQFRITIPRDDGLWAKIHGLFKNALRDQSRGSAAEVEAGIAIGAIEVPYWAWTEHLDAVTDLLNARAKEEDLTYQKRREIGFKGAKPSALDGMPLTWGLIKNVLHGCRCVFSAKAVEISPEVPPVDRVLTYESAKHRIFMSATISDESVLVRELGCSEAAAANPVELPDAGGLGERMILVPRLMTAKPTDSIKWEELAELCKRVTSKGKAVVVLAPSKAAAKRWAPHGALVVDRTEDVPGAVAALRSETAKFVVFANRYDGLDLPDEACRLLVIDGAPVAYSVTDMVDMACRGATGIRRRTVMHRIEQGLGRGVRSPSDFAVVLLYGNDVVELISMVETRQGLTAQTRKQIEFGIEIAKSVRQGGDWRTEIETLIWQCLNRDGGWKRAYQLMTKASASENQEVVASRLAQAVAERAAWNQHVSNRGADAAATMRAFLNKHSLEPGAQAFLLQRVAWYERKDDPAKSLETQTFAREQDPQLLMPPSGVKYRKGASAARPSAIAFVQWLETFDTTNAAIAALDALRTRLTFAPDAPHEQFEQGLCDLGAILGFESRRPDREIKDGPDVLWLEGLIAVPLEAKNRTSADSDAIAKHVAAQLMQAEAWTKQMYPERTQVVPVSVHPRSKCGDHAIMPSSARVLTPEHLYALLDALQVVVGGLQRVGGAFSPDVAGKRLAENSLTLAAILSGRTAKPT